jgi:DNA-binding MarR family transcriptional regulator
MIETEDGEPAVGVGFLLAQLGAHAANRFAERVAAVDLTPPQTGLLLSIAAETGRSQQAIATALGMPPSRLVALIDDLEAKGLIERRRDAGDRRNYALHPTASGHALLGRINTIRAEHESDLCAALGQAQRDQLKELLQAIVVDQGLTPGVHPGYRRLGGRSASARP